MFERFTERARRVVVVAQEECVALGHDEIGSEHLLLALTNQQDGLAGQALGSLGIDLRSARSEVVSQLGRRDVISPSDLQFSVWVKSGLRLSDRESKQLGHDYVGTEHLLLGLIRMGKGRWLDVVHALGVNERDLRASVLGLIDSYDSGDEGLPLEDRAPQANARASADGVPFENANPPDLKGQDV